MRILTETDEWNNEITDFNKDMSLEEREYYGREFDDNR